MKFFTFSLLQLSFPKLHCIADSEFLATWWCNLN